MEYQAEIDNFLTEYLFSCIVLNFYIVFLYVMSSTLVLCNRLHLYNFLYTVFTHIKSSYKLLYDFHHCCLYSPQTGYGSTRATLFYQKGADSFCKESAPFHYFITILLLSWMNLLQHAVLDHIVVTQQFFHYGALDYTEQRLLQCI